MKAFNDENFLLQTETAQRLYHEHAAKMPIIDYHCHLIPEYVASDHKFENLSRIWLEGDHYKWRAMRTNGVDERYCTGKDTSDWEKFEKWAETVPYTMRNPLYHWTHLELKTAFGVDKLLSPTTAREIYDHCTAMLQRPDRTARGLMLHYNVETVCTTDDPVDSLEHHLKTAADNFGVKMLPTWRPDKAMAVEVPADFKAYIDRLSEVSGVEIRSFDDVLQALQVRHDFFESVGCRLSDHGIEEFYAEDYTHAEVEALFQKVYGGTQLTAEEIRKYKTAMMVEFAIMDHKSGWTQQFHYGAIRNNNSRMFAQLGPDTGFDSIGDFTVAKNMSKFFDLLDKEDKLTKTIMKIISKNSLAWGKSKTIGIRANKNEVAPRNPTKEIKSLSPKEYCLKKCKMLKTIMGRTKNIKAIDNKRPVSHTAPKLSVVTNNPKDVNMAIWHSHVMVCWNLDI